MSGENNRFYVRFKSRVLGPMTLDKIQELARPEVKKITSESEISTDGLVWRRAGEFPRLFDIPESRGPKTILESNELVSATGSRKSGTSNTAMSESVSRAVGDRTLGFGVAPPRPFIASNFKGMTKPNGIPAELEQYSGYEIISEIGHGGMGVVYLARNVDMDRYEVLKVLSKELDKSEEAGERFMREIRAVSKLDHPSIVRSLSVLSLGKLRVFAMEYVDGENLQQFVHRLGALPVELAYTFTCQIAAGLQHAFECGLVHRDIKPSNIMVYQANGKLLTKILDFGLAKASSEKVSDGLTQNGSILGTAEYLAPEQMRNAANADIRADIYSLGCTLYHMLVGHPPFNGTTGEIMMSHAQQTAASVDSIRPDVSSAISSIVSKMMSKDVSSRYQTPQELIDALSLISVDHGKSTSMKSLQLAPDSFLKQKAFEDTERIVNYPTVMETSISPQMDQFQTLLAPPPSPILTGAKRGRRDYSKRRSNSWMLIFSAVVMLASFASIIAIVLMLIQRK